MPPEPAIDRKPAVPFSSLPQLFEHHANLIPDAPAILAPGRAPLTYGRFYEHVESVGAVLRELGMRRRDRIAVVLPNGPEMAIATLSVAANATCAPVNPAYRAEELDRYFAALQPRAVIVQTGVHTPVRRVAESRGIRVIEISARPDSEAGLFTIAGKRGRARPDEPGSASDTALLMLTSGTTSRPKMVPQGHAKLCASAHAHIQALALSESDRCLNILPLFHGHGLIASVLSSLAAGASVVCTPGLDANSFSAWLTEFQPTWYSAVPTMHQAILGNARQNRGRLSQARLRFVRASSAPLSPRVFAELEQAFETCVIEWYGMGEVAAAPITCNPLPPRPRKPGSVGVPVALDVAVVDEAGNLLPPGQPGEIAVRGPTVMAAYVADAKATDDAFAGDRLMTGDVGYFDADGYLFLTGRVREMINRGGEKISPWEVEEVLLEHPAVAEAVTFAVPHVTLSEDVASAIVLRPNHSATPKEIRRFASGRMAGFKVPRQILIVDLIPRGPTGKVQRIGLASKLGVPANADLSEAFVAPRTPLEKLLSARWAEILKRDRIGIHDDFFALGGDSLLATRVMSHIYDITKIELGLSKFFEALTVAEVATQLEQLIGAGKAYRSSVPPAGALRENGAVPGSIAQEQCYKLQRALPGIPFFNVLYALRILSSCDKAILERSINEIVRRHDILRTSFAVIDGRFVQVIAPQLTLALTCDDLIALSPRKKDAAALAIIRAEAAYSFDLAKGPLIRARLIRLAEREHLLLVSMHQTICDGWSLGVLFEELTVLYDAFCAGAESPLPSLPLQYADFAVWQRRWKSNPAMAAQLAFWRQQLRDPLHPMQLARSAGRPRIDHLCTVRRAWSLPGNLAKAAKRFAQQEGGTLFMALVAALDILLYRYLGQADVRVATNVANRNRPGTAQLIGPLANTVILRASLGGNPTARELLHRVRESTLAALAHQDFPIEELAQILESESGIPRAPLANVMILLQNAALRPSAGSSGKLDLQEANPGTMLPLVTAGTFDVILMLHERADGLRGTCIYKPNSFSARTIARLLANFERVLERMVSDPDRPISAIRLSPNAQVLHA
jgi:acyl-CoA synthetase (AMP-forming)/AMP-acid ligase II